VTFEIASLSRTGGRQANEDYADFLQTAAASCWVLADGLGGHRGGATASKTVVDAALASFRAQPAVSAAAVSDHIARAQAALLDAQRADPALSHMRSTIVVLVSTDRDAVWGHVGDSRLYHLQGGRISARTRDHSVSQALVDGGQLDEREQGGHEDRSRLLRCLGKEEEIGATVSEPRSLCQGDAFLLCSDGFWESVDDVAVEIDLAGAEDAAGWIERMEARLGRGRVSKDNYTATAIRLLNDAAPACPPHDPRQPAQTPWNGSGNGGNGGTRSHVRDGVVGDGSRATFAMRLVRSLAIGALAAVLILLLAAGAWKRAAIVQWLRGAKTDPAPQAQTDPHQEKKTQLPPTPRDAPASPPASPHASPQNSPLASPLASPPASPGGAAPPPDAGAGAVGGPSPRAYADPSALPEQMVFRPKTGQEYARLADAIADATAGETIWIGPGEWTDPIPPIAKALVLKGAGRDRSRINLSGHAGLTMTGASGGLEDVDICCATGDAVVQIAGAFQGRIAHARVRRGAGWGLLVHGSAAVDSVDVVFEENGKGTVRVRRPATLSMQ
jgi:serine/threonine protein phosphatase PrpC